MQGQVAIAPRPMLMKMHLAEMPTQRDFRSANRAERYTSDMSQSGPLSLHSRLCNDFAKKELERYKSFSILCPGAESIIVRNVDYAFPLGEPPVKKSRPAERARSARPSWPSPDKQNFASASAGASSSSQNWSSWQNSDNTQWHSNWHDKDWSSSSWSHRQP